MMPDTVPPRIADANSSFISSTALSLSSPQGYGINNGSSYFEKGIVGKVHA